MAKTNGQVVTSTALATYDDADLLALAVKPKQDNAMIDVEMGVAQVMPGTSWSTWSGAGGDGKEVINQNKITIDQFVDMRRRDGQARALMRLYTLPIRAALKEAEWVEPESGGGEKEVEFANLMFKLPPSSGGMSVSLSKVIRQTLLGLVEGYAVFEEVRQIPEEGELKGKITLRKLAYRDPRTIRFRVDDTCGFDGVRQITNLNGKMVDVKIPKEKVWYYSANEEENPYYGVSYFESAWHHYDIKKKLYYIAHLAAQFAAVPGRMGTYPRNADPRVLQAFKDSLANFAFNTAMVMPEGYLVAPFNGTSGFDFLKLIDHHNTEMAKSVLAQFIQESARPVLVDNSSAVDAQSDMFVQAVESIMNEIAESWTQHLMPKYIKWNFGNDAVFPVFRFGNLTDSSRDAIKDVFTAVVTAGTLNCTPEFVRELEIKLSTRLGLDVDYETIAKHEKEQAEAEAKAQADAAQQQADAAQQAQDQMAQQGGPGGPPVNDNPFAAPGAKLPGALPGPATSAGQALLKQSVVHIDNEPFGTIDELVSLAQELLLLRPEDEVETPVDGEDGL